MKKGNIDGIEELEELRKQLLARLENLMNRKPVFEKVVEKRLPTFRLEKLADYVLRLVYPMKEAYNFRANRWLDMKWTKIPIEGVVYHLIVGRDSSFSKALEYRSKNEKLSVQFDNAGSYAWKVIAESASGLEKLESKTGEFEMSLKGGKGGEIKIQNLKAGGAGYKFTIAKDASLKKIVLSGTSLVNRCPTRGVASGSYYCKIENGTDSKDVQVYPITVK